MRSLGTNHNYLITPHLDLPAEFEELLSEDDLPKEEEAD